MKYYVPDYVLPNSYFFNPFILGTLKTQENKMTISYSREVFTSTGTGIFLRLLGRWKGSIYKLVWRDLFVYVSIYTVLSVIYRFELSEEGKYNTTIQVIM